MFALAIRYLNGWAMAMHPSDRERAEWPPHPDRVFMALAAAHFETGEDDGERAALEWLERLVPPEIAASDAERRDVIPTYVPVNDTEIKRPKSDSAAKLNARLEKIQVLTSLKEAKASGLAILPEYRSRQSLPFPVAIPHDPNVYLIWRMAQCPAEHCGPIESLCKKVTSVGDPSSMVQMWVENNPPVSTLLPDENGVRATRSLRVFGRGHESGRLSRLAKHHELEMKLGRRQRIPSDAIMYRLAGSSADVVSILPSTIFDPDLIILRRISGSRLGLESTLQLVEALRGTVMSKCPVQPPPAWISGHAPEGGPWPEPHLAFLPLADIGHDHALGHLLGVAVALPRGVSGDQEKLLGAVFLNPKSAESRRIELGIPAGVWQAELADDDPRVSLQSQTWTAAAGKVPGSQRWATVTPIVFDRHPKETWSATDSPRVRAEKQAGYWTDVENMVADTCEKIGLPRPIKVTAFATSALHGVPTAAQMPRLFRKDGSERRQTHAVLRFEQRVVGPVLLGAGRFRGYGLCRPLQERDEP